MSQEFKCPYCGGSLQENALFCPFCMRSLQDKKDVTPQLPKHRKGWGILLVCLLTVICAVIVGLLLWSLSGILKNAADISSKPGVHLLAKTEKTQPDAETTDGEAAVPPEFVQNQPTAGQENYTAVPGSGSQAGAVQASPAGTATTPTTKPSTTPTAKPATTPTTTPTTKPTTIPTTKPATTPTTTPTTAPETTPTTAPTTKPTVSQCSHIYKVATCSSPMTCTKCGATSGTVDAQAHDWKAITAIVRHEEKGHYETVQTGSVKKTMYRCFFCGYAQPAFESLDALREHIPEHSHYINYEVIVSRPNLGADTYETWVPVYEEKWIVDQEAYDETIINGYQCSICAATK